MKDYSRINIAQDFGNLIMDFNEFDKGIIIVRRGDDR